MENIAVSIIIPVYNVEKYLRECINSIINQTLKDIEIICIDDGSSDNSFDILEEYAKIDNRIKIIKQANQGVSTARNNGIRLSNADYICFIDADDYISNDYLEQMYNKIVETNADIIINDNIIKFSNDNKNKIGNEISQKRENGIYDINSKFIQSMYPSVWGKLYKKKMIFELGINFPCNLIHEDLCFNYKLLPYLRKAVQSNIGNYYYRQRQNSLTSKKKKTHSFDSIKVFENIYLYYKENNLLDEYELPYRLIAYRSSLVYEYIEFRKKVLEMIKSLNLDIKKMKSDKKLKLLLISPNILIYRINKFFNFLR